MQSKAWDSIAQKVSFNLEIDISNFKELVALDTSILDYGCGYGRTCETLLSQGYTNIVGVDSSSEMIIRGFQDNPQLSLSHNKEIETNFPNEQFGAIILCAVLTCVPKITKKEKILSEVKRILKPGGILHLVEFCSTSNKLFDSKLGIAMHHQDPKELNSLLSSFSQIKCEISETNTMGGEKAKAFTFFGKKK